MKQSASTRTVKRVPSKTTGVILHGTTLVSVVLALLLIFYGVANDALFRARSLVAIGVLAYILGAELFYKYKRYKIVNWMLISFYAALAFLTLLQWGLNAPVGILTASFLVILPGILMGYHYILPVSLSMVSLLVVVQLLTSLGVVRPNLAALSVPSTGWDVLTYSIIFSVFALVSWLSGKQTAQNLQRARQAEERLRVQKEELRAELESESAALRQVELRQMRQLHTFALIGQSTSATLHELSNHLSVLNLDIDDLRAQHKRSKAITNAQISIKHVNKMVAQTRQQLNNYESSTVFNALPIIRQAIKDARPKYERKTVQLSHTFDGPRSFKLDGSHLALMQILAILLNNALDACQDSKDPAVNVFVTSSKNTLTVRVYDNGPGLDETLRSSLFSPLHSQKPNGLGVGLYIAHHLATNQFSGTLQHIPGRRGATFELRVPRYEK